MQGARNFLIRPAVPDDATALARLYAPYVERTAITFEEEPPAPDEMKARIAQFGASHGFLVATHDAQTVGYAYASPHKSRASYRWSVDVAVYVDGTAHRRGIGRSLYDQLLPRLAARGFVTAYAGITLPNDASVGLHQALGFSRVGGYTAVGFKLGSGVTWGGGRSDSLRSFLPLQPPSPERERLPRRRLARSPISSLLGPTASYSLGRCALSWPSVGALRSATSPSCWSL